MDLFPIQKSIEQANHAFNYPNILWLSFDLRSPIFSDVVESKKELRVLPRAIAELIENKFSSQLIILPAFTFDFPETNIFSVNKSVPNVGSFSKYLFKHYCKSRSLHPFYSFFAFGNDKSYFLSNSHFDCVGQNSIFEYLIKNECKMICLGHHFVKSFSAVHHLEYIKGKTYRYKKIFTGELVDSSAKSYKCSTVFFARDLKTCTRSGLTERGLHFLESNKAAFSFREKNTYSSLLDITKASELLLNSEDDQLLDSYNVSQANSNNKVITNELADLLANKDFEPYIGRDMLKSN